MGEEEEEYNEIRPQDDCRCSLLLRGWKDGRGMEGRGLSKRHNKIIYVVRNADGVRGGGECQCERESERGPIYAGRKQTLKLGRWPMATVCTVVWEIGQVFIGPMK